MAEVSDLCRDHSNDLSKLVIVAASKTHRIELIEQAYNSGIKNFGENYLQEAEILRLMFSYLFYVILLN